MYKKAYSYSYKVRLQRNRILLVTEFVRFGDLMRRLLTIFIRFGVRVTPTFRTKIEQQSKNKPQKISRKKNEKKRGRGTNVTGKNIRKKQKHNCPSGIKGIELDSLQDDFNLPSF